MGFVAYLSKYVCSIICLPPIPQNSPLFLALLCGEGLAKLKNSWVGCMINIPEKVTEEIFMLFCIGGQL